MTQDNPIVLTSTTNHGYLYSVYHKKDTERKHVMYTGEISEDPKHNYCECTGWALLEKCYHNELAHKIMEVKI